MPSSMSPLRLLNRVLTNATEIRGLKMFLDLMDNFHNLLKMQGSDSGIDGGLFIIFLKLGEVCMNRMENFPTQ